MHLLHRVYMPAPDNFQLYCFSLFNNANCSKNGSIEQPIGSKILGMGENSHNIFIKLLCKN